MVKSSLLLTGIFGLGSVMYGIQQGKFEDSLAKEQTLQALRLTAAIDRDTYAGVENIDPKSCSNILSRECTTLTEKAIMIKNRLEDYSIVLTKTLGIDTNDSLVLGINNSRERIDELIKQIYGLSLSAAAEKNIRTINALQEESMRLDHSVRIEEIEQKSLALSELLIKQINRIENEVINEDKKPIGNSLKALTSVFFMLITSEILLFIIVSMIDILNNNASDGQVKVFDLNIIQPKVRPLLISIALAFAGMLCAQILLYRETSSTFIEYCRETNKQNLLYEKQYSSLSSKSLDSFYKLLVPPIECLNSARTWLTSEYDRLNLSSINTTEYNHEIEFMKLRLLADAYQDQSTYDSQVTGRILFAILILNVLCLTSTAIFLGFDSRDIG